MWELLTEDGHGGTDALENRHGEGGTNSQAINEIVEAVAQSDHPGQSANIRVADAFQPVTGTLGSLQVLQESPSPWPLDQRMDLQGKPRASRPLLGKGSHPTANGPLTWTESEPTMTFSSIPGAFPSSSLLQC